MVEVQLQVRFTQVSLGSARRVREDGNVVFAMLRSPEGQVMLLPSWWRSIARFGALVSNVPAELINKIEWDPAVGGEVGRWKRYLPGDPRRPDARRRFAEHEAFLSGATIVVACVLPPGLAEADFARVMDAAGRYKGISPYKPGQFGTFRVVAVDRRLPQPAGCAALRE